MSIIVIQLFSPSNGKLCAEFTRLERRRCACCRSDVDKRHVFLVDVFAHISASHVK